MRRVHRGGGWNNVAGGCWSAFRFHFVQGVLDDDLGFRLVKDV
jgi:formylglycine-generating enzyme required for sulfatase activity